MAQAAARDAQAMVKADHVALSIACAGMAVHQPVPDEKQRRAQHRTKKEAATAKEDSSDSRRTPCLVPPSSVPSCSEVVDDMLCFLPRSWATNARQKMQPMIEASALVAFAPCFATPVDNEADKGPRQSKTTRKWVLDHDEANISNGVKTSMRSSQLEPVYHDGPNDTDGQAAHACKDACNRCQISRDEIPTESARRSVRKRLLHARLGQCV